MLKEDKPLFLSLINLLFNMYNPLNHMIMKRALVMIQYRTGKDWSTLKVEAKNSLNEAITALYNVVENNQRVGDISIDGSRYHTSEIRTMYKELSEPVFAWKE
jgi:hypothetical protein